MSLIHHKYFPRPSRLLLLSRMCSILHILRSHSHGKLSPSSFINTSSCNRLRGHKRCMFHRTSISVNANFDFFDEGNGSKYSEDNDNDQNAKFDFFDEENDYNYFVKDEKNTNNQNNEEEKNLNNDTSIQNRSTIFGNILYDTGTKSTQNDYPIFHDTFDNTKQTFVKAQVTQSTIDFLKRSSNGYGSTSSSIEYLSEQISKVEDELYALNDGIKFNVNSPKQVASVLFGESSSESTNKDVLEALAANGNQIAEKVLLYRKIKADIKRSKYKQERIEYRKKEQTESAESQRNGKRDPLVLVDASACIFRAYFSMPPLHRNDGKLY